MHYHCRFGGMSMLAWRGSGWGHCVGEQSWHNSQLCVASAVMCWCVVRLMSLGGCNGEVVAVAAAPLWRYPSVAALSLWRRRGGKRLAAGWRRAVPGVSWWGCGTGASPRAWRCCCGTMVVARLWPSSGVEVLCGCVGIVVGGGGGGGGVRAGAGRFLLFAWDGAHSFGAHVHRQRRGTHSHAPFYTISLRVRHDLLELARHNLGTTLWMQTTCQRGKSAPPHVYRPNAQPVSRRRLPPWQPARCKHQMRQTPAVNKHTRTHTHTHTHTHINGLPVCPSNARAQTRGSMFLPASRLRLPVWHAPRSTCPLSDQRRPRGRREFH